MTFDLTGSPASQRSQGAEQAALPLETAWYVPYQNNPLGLTSTAVDKLRFVLILSPFKYNALLTTLTSTQSLLTDYKTVIDSDMLACPLHTLSPPSPLYDCCLYRQR